MPSRITPEAAPTMLPRPPFRLTPPITAAAKTEKMMPSP